jgi:hypothetical protein
MVLSIHASSPCRRPGAPRRPAGKNHPLDRTEDANPFAPSKDARTCNVTERGTTMFCFTFNGQRICIPLYFIVRQWVPPWVWPIVNPRAEPSDPSPWKGRWIEAAQLSDTLQRELAVITLMNELAKTLAPARTKSIHAALHSAIHPDRDLPKGMTFTL